LGARIRARRKRKGWTLQDLGDATKLSVPYLSDLERREGINPTLETLEAIAGALDCTVAELIGNNSTEPTLPPASLTRFVKTDLFRQEVKLLADRTGMGEPEMERQLISFLAVAPRRSSGDLTSTDWQRLLDVFRTITDPR